MGLNEEQIANAIGICLSHSLPLGILDCHREENVMAKNMRFGFTAHHAIISCMLAKNGFTGPMRVIEGDSGFKEVVLKGEMDLERLTDFSGWLILKNKHKALCANANTQGHIFATLAIVQEQDLKPEDIASVRIQAPDREAHHTTTMSKKYPRSAENADHSAFYGNAFAIKYRNFGPESSYPEHFTDPVILDLIEKITVEEDPSQSYYGHSGKSQITTKDGRRFEKFIEKPHGLDNPGLTDKEIEDKFTDMAIKYMGKEQISKIFDTVWNVEQLDDLGKLTKLLIFPAK